MNILFPGLKATWIEVDIAKAYETRKDLNMFNIDDQSILANSLASQGIKTYGGFGEDRTELWKDFGYPTPTIHLGIDFNNLDPGQGVGCLSDGFVVDVWYHNLDFDGWGGRVVIEGTDGLYYMYGHLHHHDGKGLPYIGYKVKRGDIIGTIGSPLENGGWFPHLHLQIMSKEYVNPYIEFKQIEWKRIDGYGTCISDGILNPMDIINKIE